jgi:hypothetical protein
VRLHLIEARKAENRAMGAPAAAASGIAAVA